MASDLVLYSYCLPISHIMDAKAVVLLLLVRCRLLLSLCCSAFPPHCSLSWSVECHCGIS